MRGWIAPTAGELEWAELPDPTPGPGEVLLGVAFAGVNRADCAQRDGVYPPPPGESQVLGLEASGTVLEVGPGVTSWQVGAPATALLAGGGFGERVVVPQGQLLPIPQGLTLTQAAALPEAFATAWLNLVDLGGLGHSPKRVLIHAGASGVGTAAVQLATALGHHVWVSVGSSAKVQRCVALGAEGGTVRTEGNLLADVKAWAGAVDLILDPVGASALATNQKLLATDGRLVLIGLLGGRAAELDLGRLLVKRQQVLGSTLRSRPRPFKAALCASLERAVWPMVSERRVEPVISEVLDGARLPAALARLESNEVVGKIVLAMS